MSGIHLGYRGIPSPSYIAVGSGRVMDAGAATGDIVGKANKGYVAV